MYSLSGRHVVDTMHMVSIFKLLPSLYREVIKLTSSKVILHEQIKQIVEYVLVAKGV
jgi:hypothetical protein